MICNERWYLRSLSIALPTSDPTQGAAQAGIFQAVHYGDIRGLSGEISNAATTLITTASRVRFV
jgi:hypothetical protein